MFKCFKFLSFIITTYFFVSVTFAASEIEKETALQEVKTYLTNLNFRNYHYPFAKLTKQLYPANQQYELQMRSDDDDGKIVTIKPASENTIGSLNQTYDEALFTINGRLLEYAAFYDDWSIKETSELLADDKIIRVTYDTDSNPITATIIYRNDSNSVSYQLDNEFSETIAPENR